MKPDSDGTSIRHTYIRAKLYGISVASMAISLPRTNSIRTQAVEMTRTHRRSLSGTRSQILCQLVRQYRYS